MLGSSETFDVVSELDNSTLFVDFYDSTFVFSAISKLCLKRFPRIVFELLVTEAKTTVFLIDVENYNVHLSANLSEFRGVLNLLSP